MEQIDPTKTFRLILQNPNGLSLYSGSHLTKADLYTCRNYGAAALSLPETNSNWNSSQISLFTSILRDIWPNTSYSVSRSEESFLAPYQPGGTATIITNPWASRLIGKGTDPLGLGRWSYCVLRGKHTKKIFIITAYNSRLTYGDNTTYQ
jgi:hypothetical protein